RNFVAGRGSTLTPFKTSESAISDDESSTVVSVAMPARVSDRLPAAGRFCAASRFPQYLTRAMFEHARARAITATMYASERNKNRRNRVGPSATVQPKGRMNALLHLTHDCNLRCPYCFTG